MSGMAADLGPGKRVQTLQAQTSDGTPIDVDVVHLGGQRPGPHLAVFAAMHGTEYASVVALGRLIQSLDPSRLSGTLSLVPVANRLAFETRTMYLCPPDGKNLNRTFPGDAAGTYAEVLADLLWRQVARQASHVLDIHGGELVEGLVPFTGAYALEGGDGEQARASRQLAEAFQPAYLVLNQVPAQASGGGRLAHTATRAGIPAALVEAGQRGGTDESDVRFITDGILNVLRTIGMLPEAPLEAQAGPVVLEEIEVYARTTGLFLSRVAPGDAIRPGDDLGVIVDYLGREVERFTSQWDGVVLGVIGPAMVEGRFPLVIGTRV
jgi:predicted deacylase